MIVGLGGGGLGITSPQMSALQDLLKRMPIDGAAHSGSNGMESMIHNVIRSVYPLIPVHVLPILGKYSSIASQPLPQFPQTIIYQADSQLVVDTAILQTVWGVIFLPERTNESGERWELVFAAREAGMPVVIIWSDGEIKLERNDL